MLIMTAGLPVRTMSLTPQEKAEGWVLLFDGKTLDGWDSVVPQAGRGRGPAAALLRVPLRSRRRRTSPALRRRLAPIRGPAPPQWERPKRSKSY